MMFKIPVYILLTCITWCISIHAAEEERLQFDFRIYMWPGAIAAVPAQSGNSNEMPTSSRSKEINKLQQRFENDELEGSPVVDNYKQPEIFYLADGVRKVIPLSLNKGRLSSTYHYHGAPTVHFFKEVVSMAGERAQIPLAHISVSSTVKELILLFFPVSDGTYHVIPIESPSSFINPGNALVYNLSNTRLACTLGGPTFELKPNQSKLHSLGNADGFYQPLLAASEDKNGKWKRRIERKLTIDKESSMLLILYNLADRANRFKLLPLRLDDDEPFDVE